MSDENQEVSIEAVGMEALEGLDIADLRKELDEERAEKSFKRDEPTVEASDDEKEMTPDEAVELRNQKKARIAQILQRGILNEKLQRVFDSAVPDGFTGKFVRDTDGDIIRYDNLMFGFTYKENVEHLQDPDGRIRVGDVVLMTILKDDRAILREVRIQQIQHKLGASKAEYDKQMKTVEGDVEATDDSTQVQSIRG